MCAVVVPDSGGTLCSAKGNEREAEEGNKRAICDVTSNGRQEEVVIIYLSSVYDRCPFR